MASIYPPRDSLLGLCDDALLSQEVAHELLLDEVLDQLGYLRQKLSPEGVAAPLRVDVDDGRALLQGRGFKSCSKGVCLLKSQSESPKVLLVPAAHRPSRYYVGLARPAAVDARESDKLRIDEVGEQRAGVEQLACG